MDTAIIEKKYYEGQWLDLMSFQPSVEKKKKKVLKKQLLNVMGYLWKIFLMSSING